MITSHTGVPDAGDYLICSPEDSDTHPWGDWQTKLVNSCLVVVFVLLTSATLSGCAESGYTLSEREKQQARIERLERRVDALEQRSAR